MKKSDIMKLVNSSEGIIRINPICTLRRWTVDSLGNRPVDRLSLDFDSINGMGRFVGFVEIQSREYSGIIAEIESAIKAKMEEVSACLCTALKNGYSV